MMSFCFSGLPLQNRILCVTFMHIMQLRRKGRPRGSGAIYEDIAAKIGAQLSAGNFPAGRRVPSFRQFAKEFGVSIKTIQRAVGILKTEGRLCVRPDRPTMAAIGAPLSSITEGAVALVLRGTIASTLGGWGAEMVRGVFEGVDKSGRTLVVLQHSERWRQEFPAGLRNLPLKGVLVVGPVIPDLLQQYQTLGHPVVILDQPISGHKIHSVSVANFDAAFDATQRVIARRHRKIAFINYFLISIRNVDPDAKERQAGFVAACKDAGLHPSQYKVFMAGLDGRSPVISEVVSAGFSAVVTANSFHARQIETVAAAARLKVPQDISVVAFRPSGSQDRDWSGPQSDFTEFGRLGVKIIERPPATFETLRVKTVWNEGNSLAAPPRQK
jgi:DNA-binding LacI/PurR family transcriptional regulator